MRSVVTRNTESVNTRDDVVGGELVHHLAGEAVGAPERRDKKHRKRSQVGHHEPGHRRDKEEGQRRSGASRTPRSGIGVARVTP